MSVCYVDLIDACHLKCPTCVRGARLLPNTAQKMDPDRFERIVRKARSEGYDAIGLYNWTEPFLNPGIPDYIARVKRLGLACDVSTTLSFANRRRLIDQALGAGLDTLIVSVSGHRQEVHEINHRGGNLAFVRANLEHVSRLLGDERIETSVVLRFLKFAHNADEQPLLEDYARSLGIAFEVLDAAGDPNRSVSHYAHPDAFLDRLRNFSPLRPHEREGEVCPLIMDTVSVDAGGKVFICCAYPNYGFLEIGSYLDLSRDEILWKRYTHPICGSCGFPRRVATDADRDALIGALGSRLGSAQESVAGDKWAWKQWLQPIPRLAGIKRRLQAWLGRGQS